MFGCAGSCQGFCLDTKSRHPSPNTTLPAKRSFPPSSLPDTYCNTNSLCAKFNTALRPYPDSIPPAMRSNPLWLPAAAPSEGCCRRASAAVPTQRTAVASRCSSWPPTRSTTMPRLPPGVRLAGAAPLAPAAPLPPRFAELRPAEWPWSARLLTRSL